MSTIRVSGLEGRVALVTGAGRGIGRAIAETLAAQGARVAACDLEAVPFDGGVAVAMDVSDEAAVDRGFSEVEGALGPVDVLVLNAGIFVVEELEATSLASWQKTIDVNLTGAFLCARRALPGMRERGYGRVVALGSSAGKTGGSKAMAAYAASKAGIMALAKSIASEYAPYGITANALAPSLIDTPMVANISDLASRIPVGRLGRPQDVADVVTFLASEHAGYITGEVVDVNGGFLID
ncbi:MAG: SDR family oxidoreductase [Actinobacteria bacterium]|nr:SDR family oxidoreductase [Actinomycetota bacterium]